MSYTKGQKYCIDTHAWIQFFTGGIKNEILLKILGNECGRKQHYTPTVVIAEIRKNYIMNNNDEIFDKHFREICQKSDILKLDKHTAILGGIIKKTKQIPYTGDKLKCDDIGLIDCIVMAHASSKRVKVLTGDQHFKELKITKYVGE